MHILQERRTVEKSNHVYLVAILNDYLHNKNERNAAIFLDAIICERGKGTYVAGMGKFKFFRMKT